MSEACYMAMLINPIVNFDELSVEHAYSMLQKEIVPLCKQQGVKLSIYYGTTSQSSAKKYNKPKKIDRLCSVEKVQKIFRLLDEAIAHEIKQSINLYQLRNIIKKGKGESITNAECIAAMLAKGYIADFTVDRGKLGINCEFYVKLNKE